MWSCRLPPIHLHSARGRGLRETCRDQALCVYHVRGWADEFLPFFPAHIVELDCPGIREWFLNFSPSFPSDASRPGFFWRSWFPNFSSLNNNGSRNTHDDWGYLLTDVYPRVERDGFFSPTETSAEESARLEAAARESKRYVIALMEQGVVLESLAAAGRLAAFHEHVFDLRRDEILLDFARRSFVAAAQNGQLHLVEYMLRRGFPASRLCPMLAIDLVDASVSAGCSDDEHQTYVLSPEQCTCSRRD